MTQQGDSHAEKYFMKPDEEPWTSKVGKKIYNPKTGSILGRTPYLWGRVFLFYAVFYSALAGMFAGMMKGMLYSLDETMPKYLLEESRIGSSPGLGYRPTGTKYKPDSSLIRFMAHSRNNTLSYVEDINTFLDDYRHPEKLPGNGKNIQSCSHDNPPESGNVCLVETTNWGEQCTDEMGYGYNDSSPCFFIKLNKIIGWVPKYYDDVGNLPEKMPESLKSVIRESVAKDPKTVNTVWITCDGKDPADKDHIGAISYFPQQGFPGYYFPYMNTPGYLSPLVAVQFKKPAKNVLINVECRAWAKNINYKYRDQLGSCHIELMIDTKRVFHY